MDTVTNHLSFCKANFAESDDAESPWDIFKWAEEESLDESEGEILIDTCYAGTWFSLTYTTSGGQHVQFPGHKLECLPWAAFLLYKHVHDMASVRAYDGEVLGHGDLIRCENSEIWSTKSGWSSLSFYPHLGQFSIFDEPQPTSDLFAVARTLRTMLNFSGLISGVAVESRWFESFSKIVSHVCMATQLFYCELIDTSSATANPDFTTWDTDASAVAGLSLWAAVVIPNEDGENFRDPEQVEAAARKLSKDNMNNVLRFIQNRDASSMTAFLLDMAKETGADFIAILSLLRLLINECLTETKGFKPYRAEYLYAASFMLDDEVLSSIVHEICPEADIDGWVYDPIDDIEQASRDYVRHLAFSLEGMRKLKKDTVVKGSRVRKYKGGLRTVDELGEKFTNGLRCRHKDLGDITIFVTGDGGLAACRTRWSRKVLRAMKSISEIKVMGNGIGFKPGETREDSPWFGAPLFSAIMKGSCGSEAPHWLLRALYRGGLKINASSPVRCYIPKHAILADSRLLCTSLLPGTVLSEYSFATDLKHLYWVPGDGLNLMKIRKTRNGTLELIETERVEKELFLCEYTTKRKIG